MSKWMSTLCRLGLWLLRKTALALLTSLLFMVSFTLFQYASWWPALAEDTSLEWSGFSQGGPLPSWPRPCWSSAPCSPLLSCPCFC